MCWSPTGAAPPEAADGKDHLGDLVAIPPRGPHVTFMPVDLVPIRMRMIRAQKHLSQADVAKTLGLTQQAYAKLERPGANLQLRTIQQVEDALEAELLQLTSDRDLTAKATASGDAQPRAGLARCMPVNSAASCRVIIGSPS